MINEATWQYIETHANDDVARLALHPSKGPEVDMPMALQQIAGRQKAKEKLPDWYEIKVVGEESIKLHTGETAFGQEGAMTLDDGEETAGRIAVCENDGLSAECADFGSTYI